MFYCYVKMNSLYRVRGSHFYVEAEKEKKNSERIGLYQGFMKEWRRNLRQWNDLFKTMPPEEGW